MNKQQEAKEAMDLIYELSVILNTGLDKKLLAQCVYKTNKVSLIESGVNPEALSSLVKELKK